MKRPAPAWKFTKSGNPQREQAAIRRKRVAAALSGERQMFDQSVTDRSGAIKHWQSEYLPHVSNGKVVGFYALIVDITAA